MRKIRGANKNNSLAKEIKDEYEEGLKKQPKAQYIFQEKAISDFDTVTSIKEIPKYELMKLQMSYEEKNITLSIHESRLLFIIQQEIKRTLKESPALSNSFFENKGFSRNNLVSAKKGLIGKGIIKKETAVYSGKVPVNRWVIVI